MMSSSTLEIAKSVVRDIADQLDTQGMRPCTRCKHGRVLISEWQRTCASCREKRRVYGQTRKSSMANPTAHPQSALVAGAVIDQLDIVQDTRPCSQCNLGRILISEGRETCKNCRDKWTRNEHMRRLNKANTTGTLQTAPTVDLKRKAENTPLQGMNKKFKENRGIAQVPGTKISDIKQSVKEMLNNVGEYQTAQEMYESLKIGATLGKVNFRGAFSIITDPEIGNKSRAESTARDVQSIVKFLFYRQDFWKDMFGYTSVYSCSCQTSKPTADNTSNISQSLKPQGGNSCDGKVVIKVQDDASHELNIPGQKITVSIEHP